MRRPSRSSYCHEGMSSHATCACSPKSVRSLSANRHQALHYTHLGAMQKHDDKSGALRRTMLNKSHSNMTCYCTDYGYVGCIVHSSQVLKRVLWHILATTQNTKAGSHPSAPHDVRFSLYETKRRGHLGSYGRGPPLTSI